MTIYRPSAIVKVLVRWDEGAQTRVLDAAVLGSNGNLGVPNNAAISAPSALSSVGASLQDAQEELSSLQEQIDLLTRDRESMSPDTYTALLSTLERDRDALQQGIVQGGGSVGATLPGAVGGVPIDDLTEAPFLFQPQSVNVERNGRRTPDTATVVLDFRDLPFDPRAVRAAAIEIVLGMVLADDFAAGMTGQTSDGELLRSVIQPSQDGFLPGIGTRFIGVVDDWDIDYGDDGDTVTLSCRDLTAIPMDTIMVRGDGVNMDLPIDEGIRQLFNRYPALAGTQVVWSGLDPLPPVPSVAVALPVTQRTRRGTTAQRRQQSSGGNGGSMKMWDHITDLCNQIGVVPVFEDDALVLSEPTKYNQRDLANAKRMVYGVNLRSLAFRRKLGGVKVPTIEVRSYDSTLGRCRWARYPTPLGAPNVGIFGVGAPPIARLATEVPVSGRPEERIEVIQLPGVTNPITMSNAARSIWEQIGRQEIDGTLETDDLWSVDTPVEQADLLSMRAGDELEVLILSTQPAVPVQSQTPISATELAGLTFNGRVQYLMNLGYRRSVAQQVATRQQIVADSTSFRVTNLRIAYDINEGVRVAIDFQNFLELRELRGQITTPAGAASLLSQQTAIGLTPDAAAQLTSISAAQAMNTDAIVQGVIELPELDATFSADAPIDLTGSVDTIFGTPDFVEQQRRVLQGDRS